MRRENVIGATLALLVLAGLLVHRSMHRPAAPTIDAGQRADRAPFAQPIAPPARPIRLAPLPDDDETRALRIALAPSGIPLDSLGVIDERGGHHVLGLVTEGSLALATWHGLRDRAEASGHWPVVIGDGEELMIASDMRDDAQTPEAILEDARTLDVDAWLASRRAEVGPHLAHGAPPTDPVHVPTEDDLTIGTNILTGQPSPRVVIALVPTRDGSEAPAWLAWGHWNDCPRSAVHVALFRRWRDRYGAELYGLSGSVAEMIVTRPPMDHASSMALADEHALYAYDVVAQGVASVEALAVLREGATSWYFWWD